MADYSTLRTQVLNEISQNKEVVQAVKSFNKKIKYGNAKFSDVSTIARKMSKATSSGLARNMVDNDLLEYANQVIAPVYRKGQRTMIEASKQVQKGMNNRAKVGMNPAEIENDESRILHIVNRYKEAASIDDVAFLVGEDVAENILKGAITDSIKGNAKQFEDAGFDTYINRSDGAGCCEWCASKVGTYKLNELPEDFWAVHKNCSCVFEYKANGKHSKITFETGEKGELKKNTEELQ